MSGDIFGGYGYDIIYMCKNCYGGKSHEWRQEHGRCPKCPNRKVVIMVEPLPKLAVKPLDSSMGI